MGRTITISTDLDIEASECLTACDTDDIIQELVRRINDLRNRGRRSISETQKIGLRGELADIRELMVELKMQVVEDNDPQIEIVSIADDLKIRHLKMVWDKYTLDQMELLLPL